MIRRGLTEGARRSSVKRRLSRLLIIVSATLCIATVALWAVTIDSTRYYFRFGLRTADDISWLSFISANGILGVSWAATDARRGYWMGPIPASWALSPRCECSYQLIGFAYYSGPYRRFIGGRLQWFGGYCRAIEVPHWFVAILFGLAPSLWFVRARRRWKLQKSLRLGRCVVCGYDLRATPDRCPECGTVPAK